MNNQEYQMNELKRFNNEQSAYFDTVKDFIEHYAGTDKKEVFEQVRWIENGNYGAGACFKLQMVWNYVKDNNRVNKTAHIGNVVLKCFYGADFKHWSKLPDELKNALNDGINQWIKSKKNFAQKLEI